MSATYVIIYNNLNCKVRFLLLVVILVQSSLCLLAQHTLRVAITPSFRWPESQAGIAAANQMPKPQVGTFMDLITKKAAGRLGYPSLPVISQFRFARLAKGEVCLAVTTGNRFPWFLDIICRVRGAFDDTSLMDERMGPLAADLLDLKGDGINEVVSSTYAAGYQGAFTPPIYWYTIYHFKDGLPHDVSSQYREFYQTALLDPLAMLERLVMPPLGSGSQKNAYIEAQIEFTRLKYQRKILSETKAGLGEAIAWAETPDSNLQELAVETLREINAPASIAELHRLTDSRYQGVCTSAMDAIAQFEHRQITGKEEYSRCKPPTH